MAIRFSLIFPLAEERGLTTDALRAWARQTLATERFEVIVVADEREELDQSEPAERVEQIDTEARRVIEKQTGDRVRRELHRDVDDLGCDFVKSLQAANERC